MKIFAGIILYNPEIERLKENIAAILPQVEKVLLVDNGSTNIGLVKEVIKNNQKIELIENLENKGIAFALNQLVSTAKLSSVQWILTLDQDSVVPSNIIKKYQENILLPDIGIITCRIIDRNVGDMNIMYSDSTELEEVDYCITSASLTNTYAVESIGGFDNKLFIDCVDHDICIRLKNAGYRIMRNNKVELLHEVGHSKIVRFFGNDSIVFNHSAFRHYYIIRNNVILLKKFGTSDKIIRTIIKHFCLTIIYENHRLQKFFSMLRGLINGIFTNI